jgi:hypothetical protein
MSPPALISIDLGTGPVVGRLPGSQPATATVVLAEDYDSAPNEEWLRSPLFS